MGVSSALHWWQAWQLRVLVLASLVVQFILCIACVKRRKFSSTSWIRSITWLAFLGSDAIAIYGLATLFNRCKNPDGGKGHRILEVVWAPILLIHLGGQDGITAYNIEDNELWARHILTAVSQVTVAVFVFWKSWRGGNKRLLQTSILLFVVGILKCFEKPWSLKGSSINNLVSSAGSGWRTTDRKRKIDSLEDFVRKAGAAKKNYAAYAFNPNKLFVDLVTSSPDNRVKTLEAFLALDDKKAYVLLRKGLANAFDLLYTKTYQFSVDTRHEASEKIKADGWFSAFMDYYGLLRRVVGICLLFAAIGLFHRSHRQAYSGSDVKVTYALICCTAVLELYVLLVPLISS